jgi:YidC/Oxa1 family membrane protein insertase
MSIFGIIASPLGKLLSLLYEVINDYGITIILFTIIVKGLLYPLYIKQTKSMAGMSDLQPKMAALREKYGEDKQMLNAKMAELYKEEKFNPMGGCLPMLIQMPIIMGLFALLREPMDYMEGDGILYAVHESFLWIPDLSQPDKWVLPILAGVATFISFSLSQNQQTNAVGGNQMAGMMKMMRFVFPVMILWMGRTFPAGLALYWAVGQIMQIFFNLHLNKIRKQLRENSAKKKK